MENQKLLDNVAQVVTDEIEMLRETLRLGVTMRERQRAYFKNRTLENLIASRQAEVAFDKASAAALKEIS